MFTVIYIAVLIVLYFAFRWCYIKAHARETTLEACAFFGLLSIVLFIFIAIAFSVGIEVYLI